MTLWKWSRTANTNSTADSTINWQEGQSPGSVNSSARAMMAAVAKYRDDMSGAIETGGTSTAYTATSYQSLTPLADGFAVTLRMGATNGADPTLNVDSTGDVEIHVAAGTAIGTGVLQEGAVYRFVYHAATPCWIAQGAPGRGAKDVGDIFDTAASVAPAGSLLCYGQAVSRTTYAALFAAIGTTFGSGDGSTTFNLPDCRGRVRAGKDDMGGTSANRLTNQSGGLNGDTLGAVGGSETHTLSTSELPAHSHSAGTLAADSSGAHTHTYQYTYSLGNAISGGSGYNMWGESTTSTSSNGAHTHTISGSTATAGSGSAHNNVQPTIILNVCIYAGV